MDKSYLPSRIFITKVVILIVLALVVFLITKIPAVLKNKLPGGKTSTKGLLVRDFVGNDANKNGIADWEESLWGLDPNADGASNKEYILAKKGKLNGGLSVSQEPLTDSDKMAREIFAIVMSLKEGGVDDTQILQKASEQIGEKIKLLDLPNIYAFKDIASTGSTRPKVIKYKQSIGMEVKKCQDRGIGGELNLIALALNHKDKSLLDGLNQIASVYISCAQELSTIPVPLEMANMHLALLNNVNNTGQTLIQFKVVFDDQINALSAIITYKKYSDATLNSLESINKY